MAKNKINFLEQIEVIVKDTAKELVKIAVTSGPGNYSGEVTTFTVDSTSGFYAGDVVYINDGTGNSKFTTVNEITNAVTIKVNGDFSAILSGAAIKKTDAVQYLDEAVSIYSKYRPLEKIYAVTIPDPADSFDLPDDWEQNFSLINYIEYPAGNMPIELLPDKDYDILLDDSNVYKLRTRFKLETGFRMSYTVRHSFNNSGIWATTAPDNDFYSICNIASGIYLLALASRYGQSINSGISADTVNYDGKTDQYRRLAKVCLGKAAQWLGINVSDLGGTDLEQSPASSTQHIESMLSDGRETLFHNKTQ